MPDYSPLLPTTVDSPLMQRARQAWALQMLQKGSDSSPIQSPLQGFARMAQALVGGMVLRNIEQQQLQAQQGGNDWLAGTLLGGGVASPAAGTGAAPSAKPGNAAPVISPAFPAEAVNPADLTNSPVGLSGGTLSPSTAQTAYNAGGVPAATNSATLPRGLRNNNPLNIESGQFTASQPGYTGSDGRFAQFSSLDQGVNAADRLLTTYGNRGLNTVSAVVNRWAPPGENDSNSYAAFVARKMGVDPNQPLDMANPGVRQSLIAAMGQFENGRPIPQQQPGMLTRAGDMLASVLGPASANAEPLTPTSTLMQPNALALNGQQPQPANPLANTPAAPAAPTPPAGLQPFTSPDNLRMMQTRPVPLPGADTGQATAANGANASANGNANGGEVYHPALSPAANTLISQMSPYVRQRVVEGLHSNNPYVRQEAAKLLQEYGKPQKPQPMTYGPIGYDQFKQEVYGWRDPNTGHVYPLHAPGATEPGTAPFASVAELRKEVQALPSYKNLAQAAPVYKSMAEAVGRDTRAADVNMIYGIAKIMDPTSVVREGEMSVAQAIATLPQQLQAAIKSNLEGTGRLSPATRAAILQEAYSRIGAYNSLFQQDAHFYTGIAQRHGVQPIDIIPSFGAFQAPPVMPAAPAPGPNPAAPAPAAAPQPSAADIKKKYGLQ